MIPNNACPLRITAAAGTELAGASSDGTVIVFFPSERGLRSENLHPSRGVAASGFRPLRNIPHCCLPQESGPCLSSSVADHPLRPANHRCLGRLLSHQQANGPRTHLQTEFETPLATSHKRRGLIRYQHSFRRVIPNSQADYSRVTHPCATLLFPRRENSRSTCMCQARRQRSF